MEALVQPFEHYQGIPVTWVQLEQAIGLIADGHEIRRRHKRPNATPQEQVASVVSQIKEQLEVGYLGRAVLSDCLMWHPTKLKQLDCTLFEGLTLYMSPLEDGRYLLKISDTFNWSGTTVETSVTEELGIERVLTGISVNFPLPQADGQFTLDLALFIDHLSTLRLGSTPDFLTPRALMSTAAATGYPYLVLGHPDFDWMEIHLSTFSCLFKDWDSGRMCYTLRGTVITGPVEPEWPHPQFCTSIEPVSALVTSEQREQLRALARDIAAIPR